MHGLKDDVKCPDGELGEKIRGLLKEDKDVVVTILCAIGEEKAVDAKEGAMD